MHTEDQHVAVVAAAAKYFNLPPGLTNEATLRAVQLHNKLPNLSKALFVRARNVIGGELAKMGHEWEGLLAWTEILEDGKWYVFSFDTNEDYEHYVAYANKLHAEFSEDGKAALRFFERRLVNEMAYGRIREMAANR